MNSIQEILNFRRDSEDYYSILGCDPSSSTEQILTEYKVRARQLHPDKQQLHDREEEDEAKEQDCSEFQRLQEAKETLTDPEKRSRYDKWLHSGLSVSFKQWESLKGAVHTSMHWATPKTIGRMISLQKDKMKKSFSVEGGEGPGACSTSDEAMSQVDSQPSPDSPSKGVPETVREEAEEEDDDEFDAKVDLGDDDQSSDPEDVEYDARPYGQLGYRVDTPPPGMFKSDEEKQKEEEEARQRIFQARVQGSSSTLPQQSSSSLGSRRRAFAERRDSSISSMHIMDTTSDEEMRRRFRNYEI